MKRADGAWLCSMNCASRKDVRRPKVLRKSAAATAVGGLVILVGLVGAAKQGTETPRAQSSHSANLAPTPPMGWNSYDSYCGDACFRQRTGFLRRRAAGDSKLSPTMSTAMD